MDWEAFVRALGSALGMARESFVLDVGAGAGLTSPLVPSAALADAVSGSGQAVSASNNEANAINAQGSALGAQNLATNAHLDSTLTAARAGRGQMDSVIAAALADINSLAATTTTLNGQLNLLNKSAGHLDQARQILTKGRADASTRTASCGQLTAAFNGLGNGPVGGLAQTAPAAPMAATSTVPMAVTSTAPTAAMSPMAGMSSSMPMMAAASMAANQAALSGANDGGQHAVLTSANSLPGASAKAPPTAQPNHLIPFQPIPVGSVQYDRTLLDTNGNPISVGSAQYANDLTQALDWIGITDPTSQRNWIHGISAHLPGNLLTGVTRESSFEPSAVDPITTAPPTGNDPDGYPDTCARGGLQTIPSTFAHYHQPNTSHNIYDPVANAAAAINYLMSRYHVTPDAQNLSAVNQFNPNDTPAGY